MKIMGIPIKIHPLLPFVLVAAMLLGAGADLGIALSSLMLHELSHVLMAIALKVRVKEIELMPMGGAARMDDIWQLRPAQIILIALAGPLMNALLIIMAAALAWILWMGPYTAILWIRINLSLMIFNLLPALPLDGGRILCALLSPLIGNGRALRICVWIGRALGLALFLFAIAMWFIQGIFNLTFVFCAIFLFLSADRELKLSEGSTLMSLMKRQEELVDEGLMPIRWMAASQDQTAASVLQKMQSRQLHRIAVYDQTLHCIGVVDEKQLIDAATRNQNQPLSALIEA